MQPHERYVRTDTDAFVSTAGEIKLFIIPTTPVILELPVKQLHDVWTDSLVTFCSSRKFHTSGVFSKLNFCSSGTTDFTQTCRVQVFYKKRLKD